MTREKKWTPGEWEILDQYRAMFLIGVKQGKNEIEVCDIASDIDDDGICQPTEEQIANATLMAASKNLVEALESIVECWDGPMYRHEMLPNIEKARAALAQAYGENQE